MSGADKREEGDPCPQPWCETGELQVVRPDDCSCHIDPPCVACTHRGLECDECGWVPGDDIDEAEHDEALAEVDRLRAELAKPVASPWASSGAESDRVALRRCVIADGGAVRSDYAAARVCSVTPIGWTVSALTEGVLGRQDKAIVASGPETGDEGRRLADAAAVAAGWRLL